MRLVLYYIKFVQVYFKFDYVNRGAISCYNQTHLRSLPCLHQELLSLLGLLVFGVIRLQKLKRSFAVDDKLAERYVDRQYPILTQWRLLDKP